MKPDGPLAGVRVADFSRVLAGPYATMMLADLGADVIKIEGPAGDETREWVPPADRLGRSAYFSSVNRNKRAVSLDLRHAGDRQRAVKLALSADVVVENFRPGVMDRFGLDYRTLRAENDRLIYCSITGFGEGAGAALPGYDLIVQAVGGLMSVTGPEVGGPYKAGVALVDVITGMNSAIGILAALRSRDQTGLGQRIEVNLLNSMLSALVNQAVGALVTGESPVRMGNAHPSIAPYETFHAADGDIVIAAGNDRQFDDLLMVLGLDDLRPDPRFGTNSDRVENRESLKAVLEQALKDKPAWEWVKLLNDRGVPAGRVNTVLEAIELAVALELDPVVTVGDPGAEHVVIANPISLSRTPATYRLPPPEKADHEVWWAE